MTTPVSLILSFTASVVAGPVVSDSVLVMPLRGAQVPAHTVSLLSDLVVIAMDDLSSYQVVTKEDIEAQLNLDQVRDAMGCDEVRCAADLGGALGVRYLMVGKLHSLGQQWLLKLTLIDTTSQRAVRGDARVERDENAYEPAVRAAVRDALGIEADAPPVPRPTARAEAPRAQAAAPTAADPATAVVAVPIGDSPTRGPADAWVTLVELADFQCPYSKRVTSVLEDLRKRYGANLRWVFKHLPLGFHAQAEPAARAAYCAGEQGLFWEAHDLIWQEQSALGEAELAARLGSLSNLNRQHWRSCLVSDRARDRVAVDSALAERLGARGTPSFFINGRFLSGAQPLDRFAALIDEELGKAQASRLPRGEYYRRVVEEQGLAKLPERRAPPPQAAPAAPEVIRAVPVGDSPVRGRADAWVTLVAITDFQCTFSARVQATLADLAERYGPELRVVHKHNPLSFHPHALPAALASECAREQQQFWPAHDAIFANQSRLARVDLRDLVGQVHGLDLGRWQACFGEQRYRERIERDMALAKDLGARGTPSFFINGRFLSGAQPVDRFAEVIDAELAKARRSGIQAADYYRVVVEGTASGH